VDQQANQTGDRSLNSTTKRLKRLDRLRWGRRCTETTPPNDRDAPVASLRMAGVGLRAQRDQG
jgi:hypothetical protein